MTISGHNKTADCPLCNSKACSYYNYNKRHFYKCMTCCGIFLDRKLWLTKEEEIARYTMHNNDVEDKKYQQFVAPITNAVLKDFTAKHRGIDFGAGTGPVISKVLGDHNYKIVQYDPLFHNHKVLLDLRYDYIVCCEVMEHFFHVKKEFDLLRKIMLPNGKLYCMTVLFDDCNDFHNWYYKNDPSHVFIYQYKTIYWIKKTFKFSHVKIKDRLITFSK